MSQQVGLFAYRQWWYGAEFPQIECQWVIGLALPQYLGAFTGPGECEVPRASVTAPGHGLDRGLVCGYGQDHRLESFCAVRAIRSQLWFDAPAEGVTLFR